VADEQKSINKEFIDEIIDVLREGRKLRRRLPTWGQILIEQQLPYLCVYRQPPSNEDWGTDQLAVGNASFLVASSKKKEYDGITSLVNKVATELTSCFGTFLIIEIWSGPEVEVPEHKPLAAPAFRIQHLKGQPVSSYLQVLAKQLSLLKIEDQMAGVTMTPVDKVAPAGLRPLIPAQKALEAGIHVIGIEVSPIYRNGDGKTFPNILKEVEARVTTVLEKVFFEFLKKETTICPPNYMALGRRSIVHSVWQIDRIIAEVGNIVDFLLLVTPINSDEAFEEFKRKRFQRMPNFNYHPAPFDPVTLKRQLYKAPVERIEDPTLAQLFRDQQQDIDSRITMVAERGKKRFLYSSLQLYDGPSPELVALADQILKDIPERSKGESVKKVLTAEEFAERAETELSFYRAQCPDLASRVEVRDDVPGVLVSQGNLLIGRGRKIFEGRAEALLSHEVGTHILTNYNGNLQPFKQLSAGLPGYDQLQESLAVLAEYLVGGLSNRRMRTLAARVMAVNWLIEGADFVETFNGLMTKYGFHADLAFPIAMRVYRSGGFTKDVVYLRGLVELLKELKNGLQLDLLFMGKFGIEHLPIVRELMWRKILVPAKMRPYYLEIPAAQKRLERVRKGVTVMDLINKQ
jgi:uncharacterized protein (TIGR02421 family)